MKNPFFIAVAGKRAPRFRFDSIEAARAQAKELHAHFGGRRTVYILTTTERLDGTEVDAPLRDTGMRLHQNEKGVAVQQD